MGYLSNIFDLISKTSEEKVGLSLKYQYLPAMAYPLKISIDRHEIISSMMKIISI
jgi:hypothetical protein